MFSTFFFSDYNETSEGWLEWKGNQYFINKVNLAMEDARYFCQQRHGDLATINSEAENMFLWQQVIRLFELLTNCCQEFWFISCQFQCTKCLAYVYLYIYCRCMNIITIFGLVQR